MSADPDPAPLEPRGPELARADVVGGPDVPPTVGLKLRSARERAGLGLRELARRIGVSGSLISQIETDKVTPSVGTLYAMVSVLGISMDDLFRDPDGSRGFGARARVELRRATGGGPPGWLGPVQRSGQRKAITLDSGVRWERLTAQPDPDVEFLYLVYDVGGASCEPDALMRHAGRELGYVLRGRLGVTISFEDYELAADDSISFASSLPHRLYTIGDEPVHALWVVLDRDGDARAHE